MTRAPMSDLPDFTWQREFRLFADATAVLWRAVQKEELCDIIECTHKFGGNCHCMATMLALNMDALNAAASAIEAQRAETTKIGSVEDESAVPKGDVQ